MDFYNIALKTNTVLDFLRSKVKEKTVAIRTLIIVESVHTVCIKNGG